MKIKHNDIVIPAENPFANCKLERKKYAEILTSIVGSYADGFVLAINNEWGTGKTTFIKMWQQHLINEKFKTLYFNAWENDFEKNALVPILAELKALVKDDNEKIFKSLLKKGAVISKSVLPALAKALADRYLDSGVMTDAIKDGTEAATEILKDEIDEYAAKKKGLQEFRDELTKFIAKEKNDKPIIFIIDELDRCRPNYAVEVLEQIKHFFSVPGIVFVLSIDKEQLGHAVRGLYGSEQINANEYLRRFIDLEYIIPEPSYKQWVNYLYEYLDFSAFFNKAERQNNELQYDANDFKDVAEIICNKYKLTLRQIERIFTHSRVCLNLFENNNYTFPNVLFILIFLRHKNINLYNRIQNRDIEPEELIQKIEDEVLQDLLRHTKIRFSYILALILNFYYYYYCEVNMPYKILQSDNKHLIKQFSRVQNEIESILESIRFKNYETLSLGFFLKKINLLDELIQTK